MSAKRSKKNEEGKLNHLIKKIILVILIIIFIVGMVFLGVNSFNSNKEEKKYTELLNNIVIEESKVTETKTKRMLQVEELQKENDEIVGWLEIEDTNINYPVLQTIDNDYYMTRDYMQEHSENGSLFLDKNYNWDIPSSNLLIYGHNKSNGQMFSDLLKYANKEFYENHTKIRFTTEEEDAEYEILSVFYSRVYYKSEKNVFRYYFFVNAENEKEYDDFVNNAKKVSLYDTGVEAEFGDQLITLSTCEYSQEDGRFAVVAKKIIKEKKVNSEEAVVEDIDNEVNKE